MAIAEKQQPVLPPFQLTPSALTRGIRSALHVLGRNSCNWGAYFEAAGVAVLMFGNSGIEIARITVGGFIEQTRTWLLTTA